MRISEYRPQILVRGRDKSREGVSRAKLIQLVKLLRPKYTGTLVRLESFELLRVDAIAARKGVRLRGLVLDIDETLTSHHGKIPESVFQHLLGIMSAGVELAVFSNASGDVNETRRADITRLRGMGIQIMDGDVAAKPDPAGFRQVAHVMQLAPQEIAMVGDNYLTDGGAIGAGMHFIKLTPVHTNERALGLDAWHRLFRTTQRVTRALYSGVAGLHEAFRSKESRAMRLP